MFIKLTCPIRIIDKQSIQVNFYMRCEDIISIRKSSENQYTLIDSRIRNYEIEVVESPEEIIEMLNSSQGGK